MQQFSKGAMDWARLASRLSNLLKEHYAPMRDRWVDEMAAQLSNGDSDINMLIRGMQNILGVLEAMKIVSSP
jgi:hypothetical protein